LIGEDARDASGHMFGKMESGAELAHFSLNCGSTSSDATAADGDSASDDHNCVVMVALYRHYIPLASMGKGVGMGQSGGDRFEWRVKLLGAKTHGPDFVEHTR
jgi:hypothetical protein